MSTKPPGFVLTEIPLDAKIAIVASRFNEHLVQRLIDGCLNRLAELQIDASRITVHHVPGAFEIPLVAKALAQTHQYAAIICLGAVVRGETPHFEYVAGECARGVAAVSLSEKLPVIFGVLTTNTEQQALDRLGGAHGHAGQRAAEAALEMIAVLRRIPR